MATFDSGRQRYSMNFCASHQRRSYTSRPGRRAEGQLRVTCCLPEGVSATAGVPEIAADLLHGQTPATLGQKATCASFGTEFCTG